MNKIGNATGQLLSLLNHHRHERSNSDEILRTNGLIYTVELGFTFTRVLAQLHQWHRNLKADHLQLLFGESL
jgi:hypothetical protein